MNAFKDSFRKIFAENPVFVLLLGMCPSMATSTSVINGIGMGLSATAVLICSNFVISLLRNFIPPKIRIAAFVVVIAGFVTAVDMSLQAFLPDLSKSLGVFIPLIVVNCIIFARAEAYASKNNPALSALDGLVMGIGFTVALLILSTVREIIGSGSFMGINILGENYPRAAMMISPPGGFIVLGLVIGVINLIKRKKGYNNG